ncbi:hypothetical protein EVAR_7205_1 [Eumeta japonica]|uniref:Uncharacterized protein n=1 Tax=Eumeta variegata TaxID=151549 RepID=A0A4C1T5P4_EUMVA|nr:hypothetical protein EVAR_7205_1 [Eumeta japonica]
MRVKTNQTSPNSMRLRRLITEFLLPPSSSIIRPWLPYSIKVLVKTNQTKLDGAQSSRPWLPYSIKVLVETNQTSPNSMGLRRLITEFLWPPSSSIIRPWLSYSIKVLVKTNQTSPNSMGLRRLITELLWPSSSSIIRPWLPYSIKVLVKTNQTSPNSMGLRRLITEFLWPPSSSIIRPRAHIKTAFSTTKTKGGSVGQHFVSARSSSRPSLRSGHSSFSTASITSDKHGKNHFFPRRVRRGNELSSDCCVIRSVHVCRLFFEEPEAFYLEGDVLCRRGISAHGLEGTPQQEAIKITLDN